MGSYVQLRYEEREKMAQLWQSKPSITEIAKALGRSKSTISRELKRNQAPPGQYWPDTAQRFTLRRRQRSCRIDQNAPLREFIISKLCCHYWTPEQIGGCLKHRQKELPALSHESIYAWIYSKSQKKEKLWKFLPRHKAKRGLRKCKGAGVSRIPNRVSIHERPKVVNNKKNFGNWEGDLMSFCKNSQHILVVRERKTMFTYSAPLLSKKSIETSETLVSYMKTIPCDPYASWQKGGVENTNGRLRRDMPRKTDIRRMTREDFDENILNYNTTPRKSLGWLTPQEAFNNNLRRVALRA